jgi:hypothetical protein
LVEPENNIHTLKAFCDPVRLRALNRRLYDSGALGLEHSIETLRKLAIVVANQKTNRLRSVAERPRYLPRLLRDPLGVGMGRASGQVYAASGDFDEGQHVQSLKPDGIDGKEINRDPDATSPTRRTFSDERRHALGWPLFDSERRP